MKRFLSIAVLTMLALPSPAELTGTGSKTVVLETPYAARENLIDANWQFSTDNVSWEAISIPHDFSIRGPFGGGEDESGHLPAGTGYYRRRFRLAPSAQGRRIVVDFDGAYQHTTVKVNGTAVGENHYGYNSFSFDVTSLVTCDGATENTLDVTVSQTIPTSRWYPGTGIERDVKLLVLPAAHIVKDGVFVTTPDVSNGVGLVRAAIEVKNEGAEAVNVRRRISVCAYGSSSVLATATSSAVSVAVGAVSDVSVEATVPSYSHWSPENPGRYQVKVELLDADDGDAVIDTQTETFGFRWFTRDPQYGLKLNGSWYKLHGMNLHHDLGAFGGAYNDGLWRRRLLQLKDMGCNALRLGHNPYAKKFVDLCDELGFLVLNEFFDGWYVKKNQNGHDFSEYFETVRDDGRTWARYVIDQTVRRDRNAPSILAWDIGDEVSEGNGAEFRNDAAKAASVAANLCSWVLANDPTRPITYGDNKYNEEPATANINAALFAAGGWLGMNYPCGGQTWMGLCGREKGGVASAKAAYGSFLATESSSSMSSRGRYLFEDGSNETTGDDPYRMSSFDVAHPNWGATARGALLHTLANDYVIGEFVWTGFDYIGEPTPWNSTGSAPAAGAQANYPNSSYFGRIDSCGFEKDNYYLYRANWKRDGHTLHLVGGWTADNQKMEDGKAVVCVYSDAPKFTVYLGGSPIAHAVRSTIASSVTGHGYYNYAVTVDDSGKCADGLVWEKSDDDYKKLAVRLLVSMEGVLSVRAFEEDGLTEISGTHGRKTLAAPNSTHHLAVSADTASVVAGDENIVRFTVDVLDSADVPVLMGSPSIGLSIEGNGEIVGVDNGDQATDEKFQVASVLPAGGKTATIRAYAGKALVLVKAVDAGTVKLTAVSEGMAGDDATFTATAKTPLPEEGLACTFTNAYTTTLGDALVLPTETDGAIVEWTDVPTPEQLLTAGTYSCAGVLSAPGYAPVQVSASVTVVPPETETDDGSAIALRNIAVVMPIGGDVADYLPQQVSGLTATGHTNGQFTVTWNSSDVAGFDSSAVTTNVIRGTATVGSVEKSVTASVRTLKGRGGAGDFENLAPLASGASVTSEPAADYYVDIITTAVDYVFVPSDSAWNDRYISKYTSTPALFQVTTEISWDSPVEISKVELIVDGRSWNFQNPSNVEFFADNSDTPFSTVAPTRNDHDSTRYMMFDFGTARTMSTLTCKFYVPPGTGFSIHRIRPLRACTGLGTVDPEANNRLDALEVDDTPVEGFNPAILNYAVEGDLVSAATSEKNVGITILPKYAETQKSYVVTLAEDGANTYTYSVELLTPCAHEHVDVTPGQPATCTDEGYTEKRVCLDCGRTLQKKTAVPALGHDLQDDWVTVPATCSAAGSRSRHCHRAGCDYEEIENLTQLPHDYQLTGSVPATKLADGTNTWTCSVCSDSYDEIVPRLSDVFVMRNVAAVMTTDDTASSVLTNQVAGLDAEGEVLGYYPVVWQTQGLSFAAGNTVLVPGTATVGESAMGVTGSVRVVSASAGEVNYSTQADEYGYSNTAGVNKNNAARLIDGNDFGSIWTEPYDLVVESSTAGSTIHITNRWNSARTISKVKLCCLDSNWCLYPDEVEFYSDASCQNQYRISVASSRELETRVVSKNENGVWYEYVFDDSVELTTLVGKIRRSDSKLVVVRFWAIGGGTTPAPYSDSALDALAVDGTPVAGFASATHAYTVTNGAAITSATAAKNTGITILPRNGTTADAYAVTVSEDGAHTEKYSVSMPVADEPPTPPEPPQPPEPPVASAFMLRNIAAVTTEGVAPTLPDQVWGLTATGEANQLIDVDWDMPNASAFTVAAGLVTVTGTATVDEVEKTVTASVRVVSGGSGGGEARNLSAEATLLAIDKNGSEAHAATIKVTVDPPTGDFWVNGKTNVISQCNSADNGTWITVGWESSKTISKVRMLFYDANNSWCDFPMEGNDPSFYADDRTCSGTAVNVSNVSHTDAGTCSDGSYRWYEYTFSPAVSARTLTAKVLKNSNNSQVTVARYWAMGTGDQEIVHVADAASITPTYGGCNSTTYLNSAIHYDTFDTGVYDWGNDNYIICVQGGVFTNLYTWTGSGVPIDSVVVYSSYRYNATLPNSLDFYVNGNSTPVTLDGDAETEFTDGTYKYYRHIYRFAQSVTATSLQVNIKRESGTSNQVIVNRVWPMGTTSMGGGSGGSATPLANDQLDALTTAGATLTGFDPAVYRYTVTNATAITDATAPENTGITILPLNGITTNAYAVTVSEDGEHTAKYSVYMPAAVSCQHLHTTTNAGHAATCTTTGLTDEIVCDDCLETLQAATEIPLAAHTLADIPAEPATCTTAGSHGGKKCSVCDEIITAPTVDPALGHDWDAGEITTQPTETEEGVRTFTCQRQGCNATSNEVIPKVVTAFALRNIAAVFAAGDGTPDLPSQVWGLTATGETNALFDVVWTNNTAGRFSSVGTVMVGGYATVGAEQKGVTASVRVEQAQQELVNVSVDATAVVKVSGWNDENIQRLKSASVPSADSVWSEHGIRRPANQGMLASFYMQWTEGQTISKVVMYYSADHHDPYDAKFYVDSACSQPVAATVTPGAPASAGTHYKVIEYTFSPAVSTSVLGCSVDAEHDAWDVMVCRFWAMSGGSGGSSVDPSDSAVLNALTTAGATLTGFDPAVYSYTVTNATAITDATAPENTGITILPLNGTTTNAYAVTVSEDGEHTRKYSVYMPVEVICQHLHTTTNAGYAATCTTAGLTDEIVCDDCLETLQTAEPIAALGHLWDAGTVTKEATETEEGERTYHCTRTGCEESNTVAIPKVVHTIALRNIATVMVADAEGTASLPTQVWGLNSVGETNALYDITWTDNTAGRFATTNTVVEVDGTALVDSEIMHVKASVRVIEDSSADVVVSQGVVPTCVLPEGGKGGGPSNVNYLQRLVDGVTDSHGNNADWGNWNRYDSSPKKFDYYNEPFTLNFTFPEAKTLNSMDMWVFQGNVHDVAYTSIEVSSDGESWSEVDYTKTGGTLVHQSYDTYPYTYTFDEPQANVRYVRLTVGSASEKTFVANSDGDPNGYYWFKLTEIQFFGPNPAAADPDPLSARDLDDLKVDGAAVAGFASTTYAYEVTDGKAVTAATAAENMGITILPKNAATTNAYVVTVAEDGVATAKYSVCMPPSCEHDAVLEDCPTVFPDCVNPGHHGGRRCPLCGQLAVEWIVDDPLGHNLVTNTPYIAPTYETDGHTAGIGCTRCDYIEQYSEPIPHLVPTVALRNEATVFEAGSGTPTLPEYVWGLGANGATSALYQVTWSDNTAGRFNAAGTVVVHGTAEVNGETKDVTASVRVVTGGAVPNLSLTATVTDVTGITDNSEHRHPELIKDDSIPSGWPSASAVALARTDGKNQEFSVVVGWDSEKSVGSVRVYYYRNGSWDFPDAKCEFYSDAACEHRLVYDAVDYSQDAHLANGHAYVDYFFAEPVSTDRIVAKMKSSVNQMMVSRFRVMGTSATTPLTNAKLNDLEVDGEDIDGFSPNVYQYEVGDGLAITAATAPENTGITILDRYEQTTNAYVVTVAEDGVHTALYSVYLPEICKHPVTNVYERLAPTCTADGHEYWEECNVCRHELVAKVTLPALGHDEEITGAVAPTCTEPGNSGEKVCHRCHQLLSAASVLPALGHAWDGGEVVEWPTTEKAGTMLYTCTRDGCDATKTEPIEKLLPVNYLRNVSAVTTPNQCPSLTNYVAGLTAVGEASGLYPVTWDPADLDDSRFTNGYVTVHGTARVESEDLPVTASVRVFGGVPFQHCVSQGGAATSVKEPGKFGLTKLTDGDYSNEAWGNWVGNNQLGVYSNVTHTLVFPLEDSHEVVRSVRVWYTEGYQCQHPAAYLVVRGSADGENWTEIPLVDADPVAGEKVGSFHPYTYTFAAPQTGYWKYSLTLSAREDGSERQCGKDDYEYFKLSEVEFIGDSADGSSEPMSVPELSTLKLNGKTLSGFVPGGWNRLYEFECPSPVAETNLLVESALKNAGITVLPIRPEDDIQYIVTLAEDGSTQWVWRVLFCPHPVTRNYGGHEAGCLHVGDTGTEVCERCGQLVKPTEPIPALGHDFDWPGGCWVTNVVPTEAEMGERQRECRRCHEIIVETVAALPGNVPALLGESSVDAGDSYRVTGIIQDYREPHFYVPEEFGFVLYQKRALGERNLTVNTPGRTKVTFDPRNVTVSTRHSDKDGLDHVCADYVYLLKKFDAVDCFAIRPWMRYFDNEGIERYGYGDVFYLGTEKGVQP